MLCKTNVMDYVGSEMQCEDSSVRERVILYATSGGEAKSLSTIQAILSTRIAGDITNNSSHPI